MIAELSPRLLLCFSFFLIELTLVPSSADESNTPNILFILTDDQGYGDISLHGNPWLKTPNMDRIASEGARLDRFFVEPVCAPSRAALLTGRYPVRTGVTGVTRNEEVMHADEITLASLLREKAGYSTGCFGKWHNGSHWPHHPLAKGFDTFVGFCGGHWNNYFDPELERDGEAFTAQGFIVDILTDEAIHFIRENASRDTPFFCYVPYNTPHTPASVPDAEWRKWKDREEAGDEFTRAMYALCENLDQHIGRLLDTLEELDLADDTLVIFLTDNGPNGDRFNGGMRGRKGSEMEGGVRVPCFLRWPGKIDPGTVIENNTAHIDLLPTLCAIARIAAPETFTKPLDGIDLSPLLLGDESFVFPERYHYTWRNPDRGSIRSDRYRATKTTLHDMREDPGQATNLAESLPEIHREHLAAYEAWKSKAVPPSPGPAPVPIGHVEWPKVTIKAHEFEILPREGEGIAYCESRGNANQWIMAWTDLSAYAECPVRIFAEGTYRVRFRYACPVEALGSRFELSLGEDSLEFSVDEPWLSAIFPAPEQVSLRRGGYLSRNAWNDLLVGEIKLKAGKGPLPLRLRAREMPGEAMPEFKALVFERISR